MLIYLRHADDHDDDAEHRHDRGITGKGARKASKLANKLIEQYGHPTAIYVSPFQRTRQTAAAMSERFEHPVPVHQEPRISRLFGKKQQRDPDISSKTADAVPIVETRETFHARVRAHAEDMRLAGHHRSTPVIWCITHKIVVKDIAKHFGVVVPKDFDFLDYIVIRT